MSGCLKTGYCLFSSIFKAQCPTVGFAFTAAKAAFVPHIAVHIGIFGDWELRPHTHLTPCGVAFFLDAVQADIDAARVQEIVPYIGQSIKSLGAQILARCVMGQAHTQASAQAVLAVLIHSA